MAQVVWSARSTTQLRKLKVFLEQSNPNAARRAAQVILAGVRQLRQFPAMGRPVEGTIPGTRDLIIPFGHGGYVIRYILHEDVVTIAAVKHTLEAGFQ